MTLQNKTIMPPQLTDALRALKLDILKTINCVKIGKIKSFNGTKKTAEIQILFKRIFPNNKTVSYPILVDCPIFTMQGGGAGLQMPITAGDDCIVLFSDRNIDAWFQSGSEAVPLNQRLHDISDAIALVGINSLKSSLENYQSEKLRFFYGGAEFVLSGGNVSIVSDGGAEIDLEDALVTIKNGTTNLLTVMEGLIDTIKALTVQGPGVYPLTSASISALETYKAQFEALLG